MLKIDFELPQIPRSKMEIICEVLAAVGLILTLVLIFSKYAALPDVIPSHFGASGIPDGWSNKNSILFFAGIMILVYIVTSLARYFPKMVNLNVTITKENAVPVLAVIFAGLSLIKLICVGMFYYIGYGMIVTAEGNANGIGLGIWGIVAALLITVFGLQYACNKAAKKTSRF